MGTSQAKESELVECFDLYYVAFCLDILSWIFDKCPYFK